MESGRVWLYLDFRPDGAMWMCRNSWALFPRFWWIFKFCRWIPNIVPRGPAVGSAASLLTQYSSRRLQQNQSSVVGIFVIYFYLFIITVNNYDQYWQWFSKVHLKKMQIILREFIRYTILEKTNAYSHRFWMYCLNSSLLRLWLFMLYNILYKILHVFISFPNILFWTTV